MVSQRYSAFFAVLLVLAAPAYGKIFTRCELAVQLFNNGIAKSALPDWVCLVESESSRNSAAKGGPNSNGSYDYGLFQVNDGFWCSTTTTAGKDCNVRCSDLLNDAITDDIKCAKLIYARHGFSAWYGWQAKCQGALPDVTSCF